MKFLDRIDILRLSGISRILGIDWDEHSIRVVELRKKGGLHNRFRGSYSVSQHFEIPFSENVDRIQLLRSALSEHGITTKYAVVSVQSFVKTVRATLPEGVVSLDEWIVENHEKLLRIPIPFSQLAYSYELVQSSGGQRTVDVSFVRKAERDAILESLHKAGLTVLGIGAGNRDAANGFLVDKTVDRSGDVTLCYCGSGGMTTSRYLNGKRTLGESDSDDKNVLYVFGPEAGSDGNHAGIPYRPFGLSPSFGLAAGLAVKGFLGEISPANLLPIEEREALSDGLSKSLFHRAILLTGCLLLSLLLVPFIAGGYLQNRIEAIELELAGDPAYSQIKTLEQQVRELENQVGNVRHTGSLASRNLECFSKAAPDGLWFYKLALQSKSVSIKGYALDSDRIADLMKNMGKDFTAIRLVRSGQPLPGESMLPTTRKGFVTFEVTAGTNL